MPLPHAAHGRRGLLLTALGAAIAAPAVLKFAPAARAETPAAADAPQPQGAGFYRFALGAFTLSVVSDGAGPFPVWPALAANATEDEVRALLAQNFVADLLGQATNNIMVIDTGTDRILLDTGAGVTFGPTFGRLVENLGRAGYAPGDISVVALTHGHSDHIAGLVTPEGGLAFPNAAYVMVDDEYAYWTGDRFEADIGGTAIPDDFKSILIGAPKVALPAIKDRVTLVRPGGEIAPGLRFVAAPGHTPAHSAVHVESDGARLLHLADVAHNPILGLQRPDWTPAFDMDAATAVASRRSVLGMAAADRVLVAGYHFPFPALGHVEAVGDAFHWVPTPWTW